MAKTLRKILCVIALSAVMVFTSACAFFAEEESRQISRIYKSEEEDGIYIIIEYTGDEYSADRFFLGKPEQGEEGIGIASISSRTSEDGFSTIITIEYSDISRQPVEFVIPNGISIANIDTSVDEVTNVVTVTINFSDPTIEPVSFEVQPGKDGKDGIDGDKILDMWSDPADEEGNITVHILISKYDRELEEWVDEEMTFQVAEGKQGNGILYIEPNYALNASDPTNIHLNIYYEDGNVEPLTIPKTNSWHTGQGKPNPYDSKYQIGDFYFDTLGLAIYQKTTAADWAEKPIVDFSLYGESNHAVAFYTGLTYTTVPTWMLSVKHGGMISDLYVPEPPEPGYKFLGWYTEFVDPNDPEAELSPNAGHFTVLTPVLSDLHLYARWQKL